MGREPFDYAEKDQLYALYMEECMPDGTEHYAKIGTLNDCLRWADRFRDSVMSGRHNAVCRLFRLGDEVALEEQVVLEPQSPKKTYKIVLKEKP